MTNLKGKTVFISGASRGIGEAIALRAARDGANLVVAAKTTEVNPKLPGTIFSAAEAVQKAGGKALAVPMDIRDEDQIRQAVDKAVAEFGGIDVLINNASAIFLAGTLKTPMKRFDLMHQVNVRGTFALSQACIPFLSKAENPHILNLSPPLNLRSEWIGSSLAYSLSKYGMSLCVLGMADEFRKQGIAVNALWPRTVIATAALQVIPGGQELNKRARKPEIVADAAHAILCRDSRECTGQFFIDEDVLRAEGVDDFGPYAIDAAQPLQTDLFL
ncbi:MAG: SDR family oxidoreductase [Gammaproteobacteria bacterium]